MNNEANELIMFGMTINDMDAMIENQLGGSTMMAMSLLSDIQERLAMIDPSDHLAVIDGREAERKAINVVKYVISKGE